MPDKTPEITHVRISIEEDSIYCELSDGYHFFYYQQATGEVIRERRAVILGNAKRNVLVVPERVFISNTWAQLLAKYEAHPMNWKNKAHARMMALYAAKREYEHGQLEAK